jgi:hypothetical protein
VPGRVGVCMRVRARRLAYPACKSYAPYCDVVRGPSGYTVFFDIISIGAIFEKKYIKYEMCVLIFSTTFV